uniref:Uncharacterized protein n=1 Tax=Megaselia scalaris TaxID=36166 RepID=T1GY18_MEGSC
MFNYVRECLRDTIPINKSINLIEIIDDLLFFWNVKDCCLHVINWRALKSLNKDSIKYQEQNTSVNSLEFLYFEVQTYEFK